MQSFSNRRKLLVVILALSVLVTFLHLTALRYALYYVVPWFDVGMHFLGGALVALMGVWCARFFLFGEAIPGKHILLIVLVAAGVIGVLWEVFEYFTGLRTAYNYPLDTLKDLIMDLLGAMSVYWITVHSRVRSVLE